MESHSAAADSWLAAFGADTGRPTTPFAPETLKQVLDGALALGRAAGRLDEAIRVVADIELRLGALGARLGVDRRTGEVADTPAPRVSLVKAISGTRAVLAGRWVPDLAALAGATTVITRAGGPDLTVSLHELADSRPDIALFALDGLPLADGLAACNQMRASPAWHLADVVPLVVLDGTRFVNSPGPALARSVELIAAAVHGEAAGVNPRHDELARCEPAFAGNGAPGA